MMPARTASELVEGAEGWEDHIQLLPVHSLLHPVLINGESKRGVYALEDLMRMRSHASGGAFRSPLTRQTIDLNAPNALVAVRWGDTAADREKAEATEAYMRQQGLKPAKRLLAQSKLMSQSPIVLWNWLRELDTRWTNGRLHDDTHMENYANRPIQMAYEGNELTGCEKAELALRHMELALAHTDREGAAHIRAVVIWGFEYIETYIDARVDAALRSGNVATALAWIKMSKLELPHAVNALSRWANTHTVWLDLIKTHLTYHAERYFQSRLDYFTSHFSDLDHASSPAEQRARRESALHLLEHVIKPFTRSAYATPAMASQWRALVMAEHARVWRRR
jgi:hypothetical protein